MKNERVNIIGVPISAVNMETAMQSIDALVQSKAQGYICLANVHTTVMAHEDAEYLRIQSQSLLSLPDGKPLSVVGKRTHPEMGQVRGPGLMQRVLEQSAQKGYTHYFYGNSPENLEAFVTWARKQYPGLSIVGYQPSVFRDLTPAEEEVLCAAINSLSPDFCWVALGAPRQERFCAKMSSSVRSLMIGVGGALNVLAGVIPDAPGWVQKIGMEWLYRMLQEPRRLIRRYAVTNTKFLYHVIMERGRRD